MSVTIRVGLISACLAATVATGQLTAATALADEVQQQQHNVTYRARVDGVSRGLTITYNISDTEVETVSPTVLPGQTFEANALTYLKAGMEISIRWPYTANLHCEILVDDAVVAQAEDFIAPRFLADTTGVRRDAMRRPNGNSRRDQRGHHGFCYAAHLASARAVELRLQPPVHRGCRPTRGGTRRGTTAPSPRRTAGRQGLPLVARSRSARPGVGDDSVKSSANC